MARKLAEQQSINLSDINGSGPRGRIIKEDIEKMMSCQTWHAAPKAMSHDKSPTSGMQSGVQGKSCENNKETIIPLTAMRKTIAQRLSFSKQNIPHFYVSASCLMDDLLEVRLKMNQALGEKRFSVNDFMARACALTLRDVPEMNTLWDEARGLVRYSHVDLAVAVSVEGGLITPIVKNAADLALGQLANQLKDLIERARANKLNPGEYQGGTFTISNLGMWHVEQFFPIINPPHAGILAIAASLPQPVIRDGEITIGHVLKCTLAADHRVIDGQVAAKFLTKFKQYVENPYLMLS
jgi:pyruvate dehydrogenase E2 component (dihydrolipoamide acetyltransferase)